MLDTVGKKYGKTVAQVIIRWLVERGIVVLAKSSKPERMAQNLNVFDFTLDDEDKAAIASLETGQSLFTRSPVERVKWIHGVKFGV